MRIMRTLKSLLFFSIILMFASMAYAQEKTVLKFEQNESLESVREKIKHNGYNFTVDHNSVFDMSAEEKEKFHSRRRAGSEKESVSGDMGPLAEKLGTVELPSSFDWRNYNGHSYIGPVRNQGSCGSCYAFGAAAAAEGTYNFAHGLYDDNCVDFSEAFIAFCLSDVYPGFSGCDGANYDYNELTALVEAGVCSEVSYPYTDEEQDCKSGVWDLPRTYFTSWHRIPCGDIDAIKTAIMTYGVVDAAVNALSAFDGYSGGIYEDTQTACDETPCDYTKTNHAISLVGWNDNGDPANGYWILRNSWGPTWGESGYMRIKYTSARVACEACYLVSSTGPTPTPTSTPSPTPTPSPIPPGTNCASIPNPVLIPDGNSNDIQTEIIITDNAPVLSLEVAVSIAHTYIGDLFISLNHVETGKIITLMDRPGYPATDYGCNGDNINVTFSDAASLPTENQCSSSGTAIDGKFLPVNPLSTFAGDSIAGRWVLTVKDLSSEDEGTLVNFCITNFEIDKVIGEHLLKRQTYTPAEIQNMDRNSDTKVDISDLVKYIISISK